MPVNDVLADSVTAPQDGDTLPISYDRVCAEHLELKGHLARTDTKDEACARAVLDLLADRFETEQPTTFSEVYRLLLRRVGDDPEGAWRALLTRTVHRLSTL